MGSDDRVVVAARVSFAKVAANYTEEQNAKLIAYLAKHNHWSPMAHPQITLYIKAPIFVARQLVKHQVGGVWNEVSRRYVDSEPEFFFPEVWRGRPTDGAKQGSSGIVKYMSGAGWDYEGTPSEHVEEFVGNALDLYNDLLNSGVAPEQARMILPQNTMTEWIWTGSLMFFARVCAQRLDPHAQAETSEVARQIANIVRPLFPMSWLALTDKEAV
jgi:thymidylate synthase (FAD)